MSQPSLYHYFPSKRAMVTAIVEHSAQHMVATGLALAPPKTAADPPRFVRDATLLLYESESHPRFVRFLFAVAIESEENRDIIARVFAERTKATLNAWGPVCQPKIRTLTCYNEACAGWQ